MIINQLSNNNSEMIMNQLSNNNNEMSTRNICNRHAVARTLSHIRFRCAH